MNKEYIGDGVYVEADPYGHLILTSEDGISVLNKIYLEPSVYKNLVEYAVRRYEI